MSEAPNPTGSDPRIAAFIHRLEAAGYLCNITNNSEGASWWVMHEDGRAHFVAGKDDYQCVTRLTSILSTECPNCEAD
jgi:hypothetical protein